MASLDSIGDPANYVSGGDYSKAWMDGKVNFTPDQQFVNIYKPNSPMEISNVPVGDIKYALSEGYLLESAQEQLVRDEVFSEQGQSIMTSLSVGWDGMVDGFLMDVPSIIQKHEDKNNPFEAYKRKAYSDDNKWWGGAGYVLGSLFNMGALTMTTGFGGFARGVQLFGKGVTAITAANKASAAARISRSLMASMAKKGLTKPVADKMAKSYIGRAVKVLGTGALIGGAQGIPGAIAELSYGDDVAAAEFLKRNAIFGAVAGGVIGTGSGLLRAGHDAFTTNNAFVKSMSVGFGVPETAIRYTQNNPNAVAAAAKSGVNVDDVSARLVGVRDLQVEDLARSSEAKKVAGVELEEIRRTTLIDMKEKAKAISPNMADFIQSDLKQNQKQLTALTEKAEDSLVTNIPNQTVNVAGLKFQFDNILADFKNRKAPAERAVYAKLKQLREALPKDDAILTGMQARQLLKSLRGEVEYKGPLAPRDKPYEKLVKELEREMNTSLKTAKGAEEYTEIIEALAPRLEALKAFNKSMRSPSAREGLASTLAKPDNMLSASESVRLKDFRGFMKELQTDIPDVMKKYEDEIVGQKLAYKYLQDYKARGQSKDQGIKDQFNAEKFPDEALDKKLSDEDFFSRNAEWTDSKSVISGDTALSAQGIRKLLLGDNTKGQEAFTRFLERSDIPPDSVVATFMADSFKSSKKAGFFNPASVMGFITGGYKGAAVAMAVDKLRGPALRISMTNRLSSKILTEGYLGKMNTRMSKMVLSITDPKKSIARAAVLDLSVKTYKGIITQLPAEVQRALDIPKEIPTVETIEGIINQEYMWRALNYKFEDFGTAPEALIQEVQERVGVVSGDPGVAGPLAEGILNAYAYLAQEIPKTSEVKDPFSGPEDRWRPSDYELDLFSQKVMAVQDPLSLIDTMADGSITKTMVNAVAATSPLMLEMMQRKVMEAVAEKPESFDYEKRLSVGYLLDLPLERTATPKAFSFFQQTFAVVGKDGQVPAGGSGDFAPGLSGKNNATWMSKSTKITNDVYT